MLRNIILKDLGFTYLNNTSYINYELSLVYNYQTNTLYHLDSNGLQNVISDDMTIDNLINYINENY